MIILTDANSICTRAKRITMDAGLRKNRKSDVAEIKEYIDDGATIIHIDGPCNPLDVLTKSCPSKRATEAWHEWSSTGCWVPVLGVGSEDLPDPYAGVKEPKKSVPKKRKATKNAR